MEPVRTCIGCRGRENKADLIRLVASGGSVVIDVRKSAPGRGAYLHPDRSCWEDALRRRALHRTLRLGGVDTKVDRDRLFGELEAEVRSRGPA